MIKRDTTQRRTLRSAARSRTLRQTAAHVACASVLATIGLGAMPGSVEAAPGAALQAPLQSVTISGLSQGSSGPQVKALQQALIDAGVSVAGGADGVFGPATRRAVVAFQNSRGLTATGEVDASTAEALASAGGASTSSSSYVGLAQGAQGDAVKTVQARMIELGVYLGTGADGTFGASTTRAMKQFQRWNGLGVTGTVTEATARVLGLSEGGSTPASPPTAQPDADANPYVGLRLGASGQLVKDLQTKLMATGVTVRGGADGQFGAATESALKSFQRYNGLSQTGSVSAADAQALGLGTQSDSEASTPEATSSNPYVGLKVGSSGELVKKLQQALISAGINVRGGADGQFGNATKGGLVLFQQQKGLTANGVVDDATATALGLSTAAPVGVVNNEPATPTTTTSDNPYVGLSVGASGERVRELQVALQSTGLVVRGGADGSFGAATKRALIAFQSVNGISQTGVVTEKGAKILALGTGAHVSAQGTANPNGGAVTLDRFPIQGHCFFGDTWHAARGGGRLHEGVDFIAPEGNLLYAVVDGHISKLYWDFPGALAGNGLRVAQDNGTYFTYLHMSSFAPGISEGTKVKAGDVIGFVGNTGSSATAHLHFEIHPYGGAAVNPYPYVKAIDDCNNTTPQYQQSFSSTPDLSTAQIGMSA